MTGIWVAVLVTAAGCYAFKLTGLTVPRSVLNNPRVRRFAELVPVALLAALVAVQTFGAGQSLAVDPARLAFRTTFATLYITWNLSTLLGAYGAGRLGSPQSLGIDVVGPAAFLALIWPQLRAGRTERAVGLLGAAIALTATPFLPPGVPVILAALAALAGALATPAPEPPASEPPASAAGPAPAEPA